jgi:hypothetical protein
MKTHAAHNTHGTKDRHGRPIYRPACSSGVTSHGVVAQAPADVTCQKCITMMMASSELVKKADWTFPR